MPYFCHKFNKALGFFGEQATESVHHDFKVTWDKYRVANEHPDYAAKLLKAVSEYNSYHIWTDKQFLTDIFEELSFILSIKGAMDWEFINKDTVFIWKNPNFCRAPTGCAVRRLSVTTTPIVDKVSLFNYLPQPTL